MSKKTGGPAFPTEAYDLDRKGYVREEGMTLRDYFAAKAMQGNLASWPEDQLFNPKDIAEHAYGVADAMLAERGK